MDKLSKAQELIDDALTPGEQAEWFRDQKRAKAVELLGHVSNAENLQAVVDASSGEMKAEAVELRDGALTAIAQLTLVVEAHAAKESAARARAEAVEVKVGK